MRKLLALVAALLVLAPAVSRAVTSSPPFRWAVDARAGRITFYLDGARAGTTWSVPRYDASRSAFVYEAQRGAWATFEIPFARYMFMAEPLPPGDPLPLYTFYPYYMLDLLKVLFSDDDHDGLALIFEAWYGTDITKPDTDGDGLTDFEETFVYVQQGFDPLVGEKKKILYVLQGSGSCEVLTPLAVLQWKAKIQTHMNAVQNRYGAATTTVKLRVLPEEWGGLYCAGQVAENLESPATVRTVIQNEYDDTSDGKLIGVVLLGLHSTDSATLATSYFYPPLHWGTYAGRSFMPYAMLAEPWGWNAGGKYFEAPAPSALSGEKPAIWVSTVYVPTGPAGAALGYYMDKADAYLSGPASSGMGAYFNDWQAESAVASMMWSTFETSDVLTDYCLTDPAKFVYGYCDDYSIMNTTVSAWKSAMGEPYDLLTSISHGGRATNAFYDKQNWVYGSGPITVTDYYAAVGVATNGVRFLGRFQPAKFLPIPVFVKAVPAGGRSTPVLRFKTRNPGEWVYLRGNALRDWSGTKLDANNDGILTPTELAVCDIDAATGFCRVFLYFNDTISPGGVAKGAVSDARDVVMEFSPLGAWTFDLGAAENIGLHGIRLLLDYHPEGATQYATGFVGVDMREYWDAEAVHTRTPQDLFGDAGAGSNNFPSASASYQTRFVVSSGCNDLLLPGSFGTTMTYTPSTDVLGYFGDVNNGYVFDLDEQIVRWQYENMMWGSLLTYVYGRVLAGLPAVSLDELVAMETSFGMPLAWQYFSDFGYVFFGDAALPTPPPLP